MKQYKEGDKIILYSLEELLSKNLIRKEKYQFVSINNSRENIVNSMLPFLGKTVTFNTKHSINDDNINFTWFTIREDKQYFNFFCWMIKPSLEYMLKVLEKHI